MRLVNFSNTLISRNYCTLFLHPATRRSHSENIPPRQQNFRTVTEDHWQAQLEESLVIPIGMEPAGIPNLGSVRARRCLPIIINLELNDHRSPMSHLFLAR